MNRYYVTVYYRSEAGNPLIKSATIEAKSIGEAHSKFVARVKKLKHFWTIDGTNTHLVERGSPENKGGTKP